VEIIGWLYQYYNDRAEETKPNALSDRRERKDHERAISRRRRSCLRRTGLCSYMVENSSWPPVGGGTPQRRAEGRVELYYLEEAQQEPEVEAQLAKIREEYKALRPEDIKVIDPCMGSGHILVYAFDVLMQIYEAAGYAQRDAARSILEHNLYGLDIDGRAFQLAYFAVLMKARQYNRRILNGETDCHVYAIQESNGITTAPMHDMGLSLTEEEYGIAAKQTMRLVEEFHDAKEYGSILNITPCDWNLLRRFSVARTEEEGGQLVLGIHGEQIAAPRLQELINIGETLAQKYDVVVTNPPYMGSSGMGGKLSEFVKKNYPDSKADLFAVFMERCGQMTAKNRYQAMITQHAWMFLSSFENLRKKLLQKDTVNMAHLGARAFDEIGGEVVQTTSFVLRSSHIAGCKGVYCRLMEPTTQLGKEEMFLRGENRFEATQDNFEKIPGAPVAYWKSKSVISSFQNAKNLDSCLTFRQGMTTTNNEKYLRRWHEVSFVGIGFKIENRQDSIASMLKWFPYQKGGEYRKWYGNNDYVVYYFDDGQELIDLVTKKYPKISDPEFIIKNRNCALG
jgi:hypothetical protein